LLVLAVARREEVAALFAALVGLVTLGGAVQVRRDLDEPRERGVPVVIGLFLGAAALMGLLAVVAMPQRHHHHNTETMAIGALKTIGAAQALFREADKENDGNLDYGTLAELGAVGTTGLIDPILASGTKRGYLFRAGYGVSTSEFLWFAVAEPAVPGTTGDRYFATNHEGAIFYTTSGPIPFNLSDCTMPPGMQVVGR
jgi:hypothetical protein